MRRAFTLIELLVIVAIIAIMISVGIVSVASGRGAAQVKGATRDVFATIRHARSRALVTMKPVIVTYSTVQDDGVVMAKIELTSAQLMNTQTDRSRIRTLSGDPLPDAGRSAGEAVALPSSEGGEDGGSAASAAEGLSVEDILFAPIGEDVVRGMRLKVVMGGDDPSAEQSRPSKISVFSNVDYLLGRYNDAKAEAKKAEAAKKAEEGAGTDGAASAEDLQEPVSVVWETNGRVDPHQVWIYPDGAKPEDGLLIRIDRFGAAKVLSGDGKGDD